MNILILGGAGFIGTNLIIQLAADRNNCITAVDCNLAFFRLLKLYAFDNVHFVVSDYTMGTNFEALLKDQDIVYHMFSTTNPTTSNTKIPLELSDNIIVSSYVFEACVKCGVKKIIFISSGGTVYGKDVKCPIHEDQQTKPISAYGLQKLTIEKMLYLYHYSYGLECNVIRLSNPYGPYQRPNGILGVVTTLTYKAIRGEPLTVFGEGTVVRDFIYIDDVIRGVLKIAAGNNEYSIYNLGCGRGASILEVIDTIKDALQLDVHVVHTPTRTVDVPVNYLDISRYEKSFGKLHPLTLKEGILKTAEYLHKVYDI